MAGFDSLSPEIAAEAVEEAYGLDLDGPVEIYPSYVNRVYGLREEEGRGFVAKFYRPGRWTREAILDEHRFMADCAAAELPLAVPLPDADGETLAELSLESDSPDGKGAVEESYFFALFPKMGGRNFDAESDEDWLRLGSIVGRLHAVGRQGRAPNRLSLTPELTASYVAQLASGGLIHPDCLGEFEELAREGLELAAPRFEGLHLQRIHGDLHRGNILDRPGSGLLLIDFDDMMTGPAIQDLWLLLPGRASDSGKEIGLLSEGYEEFASLDPREYGLIEPLRLMRMLYFLAWRASQRNDYWFKREFPDWGGKAFWIQEVEDLRDQVGVLRESSRREDPQSGADLRDGGWDGD
jgi:Ser/Thr protein kinase RdoA (MazF antagonist)